MPFKRETAKGIKYSTSVFDKVTGKQIRILFDTQREAKDAEAKIRSQLLDGTYWKNHTPISTDGVLTLRKFWEQRYQEARSVLLMRENKPERDASLSVETYQRVRW